jgi:hypothetical protein
MRPLTTELLIQKTIQEAKQVKGIGLRKSKLNDN